MGKYKFSVKEKIIGGLLSVVGKRGYGSTTEKFKRKCKQMGANPADVLASQMESFLRASPEELADMPEPTRDVDRPKQSMEVELAGTKAVAEMAGAIRGMCVSNTKDFVEMGKTTIGLVKEVVQLVEPKQPTQDSGGVPIFELMKTLIELRSGGGGSGGQPAATPNPPVTWVDKTPTKPKKKAEAKA